MGASLQTFSDGRFILGYGAGWHESEFRAYGYGFPPPSVRVDMLEEGIQVIRAMWTQSPASFVGKYYQITDAYCEPRPDPVPPLMIGGGGEKRTLRLVARYADWWNDTARPVDVLRHKLRILRDHCQVEGRDYDQIRKTIMIRVFIDKSHKAALARGADTLTSDNPALVGDPSAIGEQLAELADLGIDLCQLVFPNFPETNDIQLFMDEVQPHFS
jgi:alkanesulfonate monooxygenase SsuD/methylene tetrahydromethanopterin reductase-like flavin-dependent oxidoreductase (luciferase family)